MIVGKVMAEEFDQLGGVCGGTSCYWNPSINLFRPSPCHYFTIDDVITGSSISDASDSGSHGARAVCSSSIILETDQNPKHPTESGNLPIDDWNHQFLDGSEIRSEESYSPAMNFPHMELQQTYADSLVTTTTAPINSPPSNDDSSTLFPKLMIDADFQTMQFLTEDKEAANSADGLPSLQFVDDSTVAFWNSMAAASDDIWTNFSASIQSEIVPPSNIVNRATAKVKDHEELQDLASQANKHSNEPPMKRPRIDTPSHLPLFKLRKEKLGDRITALQQLVSPFGKTDTASVLHEAIDYIKFLHDQVNALCASSLKDGPPPAQKHHHLLTANHKLKDDQEGGIRDLKVRGLCLVPISSILAAGETCNVDNYRHTFGGSFW